MNPMDHHPVFHLVVPKKKKAQHTQKLPQLNDESCMRQISWPLINLGPDKREKPQTHKYHRAADLFIISWLS
jgi:hypothetical protein